MSDIEKVGAWIDEHGDTAGATLKAAIRLGQGISSRSQPDQLPAEVFTGIPEADRAIADAAGVAQIAGDEGVGVDDVIDLARMLFTLGITFI